MPIQTFRIDLGVETERTPSAVTVLLGYRSSLVSLPGSGNAMTVRQRVRNTPSNAIVQVNDLDYALRVVLSRGSGIAVGRLFTVDFDSCQNAAAATIADFGCAIEGCGGGSGPIDGCSCSVTTP
jgi:hypothetical protein